MNEAKTEKRINPKSKRLAQFFLCAGCAGEFTNAEVAVDHITPVVGPEGFQGWDEYIERMYCGADNLQVLCTECHALKTKEEREARKGVRDKD